MLSKIKVLIGLAALAATLAVPSAAGAKSNHGNHCGRGHAKKSAAVGKTCNKQSRRGHKAASTTGTTGTGNGATQTQPGATGDQNEAGDDNGAAENENQAEDQNDQAEDQNDQAEDQNDNEAGDDGPNGGNSGQDQ